MATTQRVTHFDLKPDFDLLVRPAHGGEQVTDPTGWTHYAWHVLLMCDDANVSWVHRTGTGLIVTTDDYQPIIPDARPIVESVTRDLEIARDYPELADLIDEFGYEDARRAAREHATGQRLLADFRQVFPNHIQHFIDTYREDD